MSDVIEPSRCCDEYDTYRRWQWARRQTSRRNFLMTTVGTIAAGAVAPNLFIQSALADRLPSSSQSNDPILVVIQLQGGNDGLNTIVPYASNLYYQDRPNIAVPAKSVLPIDNAVGFNPNLQALKGMFDQGKVAVIEGVGYPNPDRSHFRSTQIWESGDPTGQAQTGWLGRYLDQTLAGSNNPFTAIALGPIVPMTLLSTRVPVTAIENVDTFKFLLSQNNASEVLSAYQEMYGPSVNGLPPYIGLVKQAGVNAADGVKDLQGISSSYKPAVQYPNNALARELQLVSQIIATGLGTRIFHVTLGGFDDHVAEVLTHANLMKYFGDSVAAFYQDLQAHGKADQVVSMTFSEFGRRVRENAGRGTDHGTAAPLFVIGNKVKGGLYGSDPTLNNLDDNGDLKYGVDFRSVYGTILDQWMGGSSQQVLGGSFERLPIL